MLSSVLRILLLLYLFSVFLKQHIKTNCTLKNIFMRTEVDCLFFASFVLRTIIWETMYSYSLLKAVSERDGCIDFT